MAGVNVDNKRGGRRSIDSEVNMIPMVDLLIVTISFLLITAVWSQAARLDANANVPGSETRPPCAGAECKESPKLHVETQDPSKFVLVWRQGQVVVRTAEVARQPTAKPGGFVAYPALASTLASEWQAAGAHHEASDKAYDRAVVHAPNDMPYRDLVAVMDAVASVKRRPDGTSTPRSAFEVTFATD